MDTIPAQLDKAFRAAIAAAFSIEADPLIGVAQNDKFGDYQSNVAMGLARQVAEKTGQKTNPRAVAEQIKAKVDLGELATEVSIAGPGFINVRLSPQWLGRQLQSIAGDGRLGIQRTAAPQRVVVDYSGPNIAKQMHVGHLRSTIIGDAIARTLQFSGEQVIRQNHIGDWGLQMGMVTSAVEHSGILASGDAASLDLAKLEQMYREVNKEAEDPAFRQTIIEQTRALQQRPKSELTAWRIVRDLTLANARQLYQRLDVTLTDADVRGESDYSDEYGPMIEQFKANGIARETVGAIGIFPPGFTNRENEPRPFIIQSRDGTYQYPTFDLAAIRFRTQHLHAQRIIYTHDSRQAEHFAMLFAVARMLGFDKVNAQPRDAPIGGAHVGVLARPEGIALLLPAVRIEEPLRLGETVLQVGFPLLVGEQGLVALVIHGQDRPEDGAAHHLVRQGPHELQDDFARLRQQGLDGRGIGQRAGALHLDGELDLGLVQRGKGFLEQLRVLDRLFAPSGFPRLRPVHRVWRLPAPHSIGLPGARVE